MRFQSVSLICMTLFSFFIAFALLAEAPAAVVGAEQIEDLNHEEECHDNDDKTFQTQETPQETYSNRFCPSLSQSQHHTKSSLLHNFYQQGFSAQAYKPNAPVKSRVCDAINSKHRVAHWPLWRRNYHSVVPMIVRGNIYTCDSNNINNSNPTMEVWQARPDGTYSSLRPGVQEGECRATIPLSPKTSGPTAITKVEFETIAPGSAGSLGGLPPSSSGDYPPFGPSVIHIHLNVEGYYPLLAQIEMDEVEDRLLLSDNAGRGRKKGRFQYSGWDMRPHAWMNGNTNFSDGNGGGLGGMEVQSVQRAPYPGYDLALELEVNFFLAPISRSTNEEKDAKGTKKEMGINAMRNSIDQKFSANEIFCSSSNGYFGWISSFFKEPIAVCFPSLLDFFAL